MDGQVESSGESEAEDENGSDDMFIDVLDVLDGKGEVDYGSESGGGGEDGGNSTRMASPPVNVPEGGGINGDMESGADVDGDGDDDDDDDDSAEDEEEDENLDFTASDAEDAPEALTELANFISTLDPGTKRKAHDLPQPDDRPRKRRAIAERTEAGAEDEFRAPTSGNVTRSRDLNAIN
jgi:U3 small nucleolar RNA-associated protein 14